MPIPPEDIISLEIPDSSPRACKNLEFFWPQVPKLYCQNKHHMLLLLLNRRNQTPTHPAAKQRNNKNLAARHCQVPQILVHKCLHLIAQSKVVSHAEITRGICTFLNPDPRPPGKLKSCFLT